MLTDWYKYLYQIKLRDALRRSSTSGSVSHRSKHFDNCISRRRGNNHHNLHQLCEMNENYCAHLFLVFPLICRWAQRASPPCVCTASKSKNRKNSSIYQHPSSRLRHFSNDDIELITSNEERFVGIKLRRRRTRTSISIRYFGFLMSAPHHTLAVAAQ